MRNGLVAWPAKRNNPGAATTATSSAATPPQATPSATKFASQ